MKYYIPAIGGPYPWTVLGTLTLDKQEKPNDPAFQRKSEALIWAQNKVDELNKLQESKK